VRPAYYNFSWGSCSFFVLDTRAYRSPDGVDRWSAEKTMLGPLQLRRLTEWYVDLPHAVAAPVP